MSLKKWRIKKTIGDYSSTSETSDFDAITDADIIPIYHDDLTLIWYDTSINREDPDDQNSIQQLRTVFNSVIIFKDEQTCLKFINKFRTKSKLFLIVSGSLGRNFIPKIEYLSQINSIYIFCGRKINHECWAKKHKKIKGVFDDITDLCECLNHDKQEVQTTRMCQTLVDALTKQSLSLHESNDHVNSIKSKHDDHQAIDDSKITVTSADIPFSTMESCSSEMEVELSNNIDASVTVTPVVQYKQQMEFSDVGKIKIINVYFDFIMHLGIWPCVFVIGNVGNEVFNHLQSVLGIAQYCNSIENCLHHIHNHRDDPHFIVLCNPTNIQQLITLIHPRVRKLYIYCSTSNINDYYTLNERYPTIVSVLQHIDLLARLILWELSACIVDIGNYYDNEKKKSLAQARYRYAYRLHLTIQGDLNNRIAMIENTRSMNSITK